MRSPSAQRDKRGKRGKRCSTSSSSPSHVEKKNPLIADRTKREAKLYIINRRGRRWGDQGDSSVPSSSGKKKKKEKRGEHFTTM